MDLPSLDRKTYQDFVKKILYLFFKYLVFKLINLLKSMTFGTAEKTGRRMFGGL